MKNTFKIIFLSAGLIYGANGFASGLVNIVDVDAVEVNTTHNELALVPTEQTTNTLVEKDTTSDPLLSLVPLVQKFELKNEEALLTTNCISTEKDLKVAVEDFVTKKRINPKDYAKFINAAAVLKCSLAIRRLNSASANEQKKDPSEDSFSSLYPFSHLVALSHCAKNNDVPSTKALISFWDFPFMDEVSKPKNALDPSHILASFSTGENNPFFIAVAHDSLDVFKELLVFSRNKQSCGFGNIINHTDWFQKLFLYIIEKNKMNFFKYITNLYKDNANFRPVIVLNVIEICWKLSMLEKYEMFDLFRNDVIPYVVNEFNSEIKQEYLSIVEEVKLIRDREKKIVNTSQHDENKEDEDSENERYFGKFLSSTYS